MNKKVLSLACMAFAAATPVFAAGADSAPASAPAAAAVAPAPKPPLSKAQKARALEMVGWFIAKGEAIPVERFGFTDEDLAMIFSGFSQGAKGVNDESFSNAKIKEVLPSIQQLLDEKTKANQAQWEARTKALEAKFNAELEKTKKENKDHLAKVDKEGGYTTTASGLRYKVLTPGTPSKPIETSNVKVLYTGKLIDGSVFDSTSSRNNEPASFVLNGVIPGWTEGLQKIGKGGKVLLVIPAEIGYGDRGSPGGIPPHSTLLFEVELLDFTNDPPAPAAAAVAKP